MPPIQTGIEANDNRVEFVFADGERVLSRTGIRFGAEVFVQIDWSMLIIVNPYLWASGAQKVNDEVVDDFLRQRIERLWKMLLILRTNAEELYRRLYFAGFAKVKLLVLNAFLRLPKVETAPVTLATLVVHALNRCFLKHLEPSEATDAFVSLSRFASRVRYEERLCIDVRKPATIVNNDDIPNSAQVVITAVD